MEHRLLRGRGRREFLQDGSRYLLAAGVGPALLHLPETHAEDPRPAVRFGVATDLHYAERDPAGSRYYRETLTKLHEAGEQFRRAQTDFVVELGDLIDAAESVDQERGTLQRIHGVFSTFPGQQHYVLGNHCVYTLTKQEFLNTVGRPQSYYSFAVRGIHFVVLDGCFRADGEPYGRRNAEWTDANIPTAELEWLRADLARATGQVVVFIHQRLDVAPPYGVKNAAAVRDILERSGKVLAVLQGHHHRNEYQQLGGIHYATLVAMVDGSGAESSGYAIVEITANGTVQLTGFRRQQSYTWARPS